MFSLYDDLSPEQIDSTILPDKSSMHSPSRGNRAHEPDSCSTKETLLGGKSHQIHSIRATHFLPNAVRRAPMKKSKPTILEVMARKISEISSTCNEQIDKSSASRKSIGTSCQSSKININVEYDPRKPNAYQDILERRVQLRRKRLERRCKIDMERRDILEHRFDK